MVTGGCAAGHCCSIPPAERRAAGYDDGLVRYSVGIENVEDLIADLRQALDSIAMEADGSEAGEPVCVEQVR